MYSAIVAAIIVGLAISLSLFGALMLSRWWINRKQAEIEHKLDDLVRSWVESPAEGKPSQLSLLISSAGDVIGQAVAQAVLARVMASNGQVARQANLLADGLEAQQNPLGAIFGGLGGRGKGAAVQRLMGIIGGMLSKGGNQQAGDTSGNGRVSLRKMEF